MNKERRAQIRQITKELALITVRVESQGNNPISDSIKNIINALHLIVEEEESALYNVPESLRYSQRCVDSEDSIDDINAVIVKLYGVLEEISPVVDKLNDCVNMLSDLQVS